MRLGTAFVAMGLVLIIVGALPTLVTTWFYFVAFATGAGLLIVGVGRTFTISQTPAPTKTAAATTISKNK
jgi:membrane protein implicated in regulation of membrane protease activity